MKKTILALAWAAMMLLPRFAVAGAAYDELTDDEKTAVQQGQQVFHQEDVDGAPWPRMYVYQRVDATPEECEAVSMDYELRTKYTKDLLSAKISKQVSPVTTEVDYLLHVPVVSDEHFTLSETVSAYGGTSYRVDWHLVRADRTKTSDGSSRFEPLGTGTLMAVTSFVDPNTFGASFVTDTAIQDTEDAATGFVQWMENERKSNQALLQTQIENLRKALAGH